MEVTSVFNCDMRVFSPASDNRPAGCHVSELIRGEIEKQFPKWFGKYPPERQTREIGHWEKGLVLEEAWGRALADMIGPVFFRPEPVERDAIWCSPDGYHGVPALNASMYWPETYPELVTPAIHECKVTLKSGREDTSPITHEKFLPWIWQVQAYCAVWDCQTAYIYVLHLMGDYKERPYTPLPAVHRLDFTQDELDAHWAWLVKVKAAREAGQSATWA